MKKLYLAVLLITFSFTSFGQVATGTPSFGSFSSGPDVINLGNLNMQFQVPIFSRPGRGISFSYTLTYNSSVWTPQGSSGSQFWAFSDGWVGQTQAFTGYIHYKTTTGMCFSHNVGDWVNYTKYTFDNYYDRAGVPRAMGVSIADEDCAPSFNNGTQTVTTNDGSGLTISVECFKDDYGNSVVQGSVKLPSGFLIEPPLLTGGPSAAQAQDANGNYISTDGSGSFIDTLGTSAMAISGSGTSTSPLVYTYKDTGGTSRTITVNYTHLQVKTAFGCSGITDFGTSTAVYYDLVDTIVFPDSSQYKFEYEPTTTGASSVTGRVAKITVPTGGTITYSYSGGSGGVTCADGSTSGLTRTTVNYNGSNEVTTYTRTQGSGVNWSTKITPPDNNDTVINFQRESVSTNFYETSRTSYSGASTSGAVADSSTTCYNLSGSTCPSTVTLPISRLTVYPKLANNYETETDTTYDTYGNATEVDEYDFGSTANTVGSLLRKTLTVYASLGNGIVDHPSSREVRNSSAATIAYTTYSYDGSTPTATTAPMHNSITGDRGNVTSISRWRNSPSSTYVTTSNTYYDTGTLKTSQDPGGHTTTFSYSDNWQGSSCLPSSGTYAYLTQVTDALSHTSSVKFYPCSGQPYSTTDQNSQVTSTTYDSMLRPYVVTRPDGGTTTYTYYANGTAPVGPSIGKADLISTGNTKYSYVQYDSYGRTSRTALYNNETSPNLYDQQDTSYDSMGRASFVSYPYQGQGFASTAKVTSGSGGDTYTYGYNTGTVTAFAMTQHGNDSTYGWTETYGRATRVWNEGTGSGPVLQKVSQIDALGNVIKLCEVSSTTQLGDDNAPANCNLDMTGTGFLTSYTYDLLGNLTGISQANSGSSTPHTRTFTYDSLSRMLTSAMPESGTTTYTYDSDSNVSTRVKPKPNQTNSSVTVTTSHTYDALHRLTETDYDDGLTYSNYYYYDESSVFGAGLSNTIGRLSHTMVASSTYAYDIYKYDSMGRVLGNWHNAPALGGYSKYSSYAYDYLGNITSFTDVPAKTFTYSYNTAGRLTGITSSLSDTTHPATLLSAVNYNQFGGPLNYTGGSSISSGVKTTLTYDSRGRLASKIAKASGGNRHHPLPARYF